MPDMTSYTPEDENRILRVSPAEFSRMQERSVMDPIGFDEELERLRQRRNLPRGTEVRVEVVHG